MGLDYTHLFARSNISGLCWSLILIISQHMNNTCKLNVTPLSILSGALTRPRTYSCHALVLLHITLWDHTRTYHQPGLIHSLQRGISSCQCYQLCIDKILHVELKPLWSIYDTSLLERANNEYHISLSRIFHDTVALTPVYQ